MKLYNILFILLIACFAVFMFLDSLSPTAKKVDIENIEAAAYAKGRADERAFFNRIIVNYFDSSEVISFRYWELYLKTQELTDRLKIRERQLKEFQNLIKAKLYFYGINNRDSMVR